MELIFGVAVITHPKYWRQAEIEILEDLAGFYPLDDLVKKYNTIATKQGFPERNRNAIKVKLKRLGLTRKPCFDNFSETDVAAILEVNRRTIYEWRRYEGLPYRKVARNKICITRKDFTAWLVATKRTYLLHGIKPEQLELLICDRKLINQYSPKPPVQRRKPVPVINVSTGQKFASIREASKKSFTSKKMICNSVEKKRPNRYGERWAELVCVLFFWSIAMTAIHS